MALKFMGRKRGMIQLFDENGHVVPCTVIETEPMVVTQIKTVESDGYNAIQFGFEEVKANDPRRQEARTKKPLRAHFKKANATPRRFLMESRVDNVESYELGQAVGLDALDEVAFVDVTATSKGKGTAGTMKRYGFAGGPAAHGSGFHRAQGSIGMRSTPGRCFLNGKRPGRMGHDRVTVQNLQVMQKKGNILVVKGSVPGPRNGVVSLSKAVKK
ncbi:MAG: 50S ribosomal protein L3 [Chlamydiia bacterium]|nr:50S ribosomal protein L3 [Chlamydiia bacterium]